MYEKKSIVTSGRERRNAVGSHRQAELTNRGLKVTQNVAGPSIRECVVTTHEHNINGTDKEILLERLVVTGIERPTGRKGTDLQGTLVIHEAVQLCV